MENNPFDEDLLCGARSALLKMSPDNQGRYEFELACQYTRSGLNRLQVGDLIGVENYTNANNGYRTYSILTLTEVFPIHFAAQGAGAYPGHVFESMRSIKEDWEVQEDKPLHATTTITIKAVSTGWQFKFKPADKEPLFLEDEKNLPMIGADIRPLSMDMVDSIVNQGVEDSQNSPLYHNRFKKINVKLDKEALLTTHFGIFGFTGVGKSNLVSSLLFSLSSKDSTSPSNVVIVDPNDEYLGLMMDRFVSSPEEVLYIHVGPDSLPVPVIKELGKEGENGKNVTGAPRHVIELLYRQMKLPGQLKNDNEVNEYILEGLQNVIKRTRIALPSRNIGYLIRDTIRDNTDKNTGPAVRDALQEAEEVWVSEIEDNPISKEFLKLALEQRRLQAIRDVLNRRIASNTLTVTTLNTALGVIDRTRRYLERLSDKIEDIPANAIIPVNNLIDMLNSKDSHCLIIISARRDSDLKSFVEVLGNNLYESRRQEGILEPFTLFLLDEADLFIPSDDSDEYTSLIKELCITLARRGRKFGLGLGIATQRASLLSTEVMGNLHTYFVSKLPRSFDREKIAEAFGISHDQLSPTFTFRPGNWLIISHDATGLKGVPIPSIADNANQRIKSAAEKYFD